MVSYFGWHNFSFLTFCEKRFQNKRQSVRQNNRQSSTVSSAHQSFTMANHGEPLLDDLSPSGHGGTSIPILETGNQVFQGAQNIIIRGGTFMAANTVCDALRCLLSHANLAQINYNTHDGSCSAQLISARNFPSAHATEDVPTSIRQSCRSGTWCCFITCRHHNHVLHSK